MKIFVCYFPFLSFFLSFFFFCSCFIIKWDKWKGRQFPQSTAISELRTLLGLPHLFPDFITSKDNNWMTKHTNKFTKTTLPASVLLWKSAISYITAAAIVQIRDIIYHPTPIHLSPRGRQYNLCGIFKSDLRRSSRQVQHRPLRKAPKSLTRLTG